MGWEQMVEEGNKRIAEKLDYHEKEDYEFDLPGITDLKDVHVKMLKVKRL